MPLYEYECSSCGKIMEANQRMSDPPLTDCECGAKGSLKRLLSAGSGLIFKGSGFYITDYKKKDGSGSKANGSSSGEGAKTDSKSSASEDKKSTGESSKTTNTSKSSESSSGGSSSE